MTGLTVSGDYNNMSIESTHNATIKNTDKYNHRKNLALSQLQPFLEIAIPFFKEDKNAFRSLVGL